MKKYRNLLLLIPFLVLFSCMEDESEYSSQEKENVQVDQVTVDTTDTDEELQMCIRDSHSPATTGRTSGDFECKLQYFCSRPHFLQPDECPGETGIRTLSRRIYQFQK